MSTYQNQDSLHKSRTEIPNIIFELGLDPYSLALYCHIKKTAGDNGECFKTNARLSKECGMSVRKLIYLKDEMTKPHPLLNGKSLLTITRRKTEKGDRDTDLIMVNDIWLINLTHYEKKKEAKKAGGSAPDAPPVMHQVQEGGAPHAKYQDPSYQDPKGNKKNVPSAIASGLASDLLSAILKTKPDAKKPKIENWAQEIDRMMNIDKISVERLKRIIDFLPSLDFWKGNILSAEKLRKQVDMLEIAIQSNGEKKEKQALAINRETNKAWVIKIVEQYPNDLKHLKISGWMVQNTENSKDVSLNMIPDRFQEVFANVFNGELNGV